MSTEAELLRQSMEAAGCPCDIPWEPVHLAWYRRSKDGPLILTHFWSVMPHHRVACSEAAASRHLFETLFPTLPEGARWTPFDPAQQIPYRHERKEIA